MIPEEQTASEPIEASTDSPEPSTQVPEEQQAATAVREPLKAEDVKPASETPSSLSTDDGAVSMPAVGDVLTRMYKGQEIRVEVTESGFLHEGTTYMSLSALAKHLTGYRAINGRKWFGIGTAPSRPRGSRLETKIKRINSLVEKLKVALQEGEEAILWGREELAAAEELMEQAGGETP